MSFRKQSSAAHQMPEAWKAVYSKKWIDEVFAQPLHKQVAKAQKLLRERRYREQLQATTEPTLFQSAVLSNNVELVRLFAEHHAAHGPVPILCFAAMHATLPVVHVLLREGHCILSARTPDTGLTALHNAVRENRADVLRALLDAAEANGRQYVEALLPKKTRVGNEVFQVAVICKAHDCVRLLTNTVPWYVQRMVNERFKYMRGEQTFINTPLEFAIEAGCEDMVELLIACGASLSTLNLGKYTPSERPDLVKVWQRLLDAQKRVLERLTHVPWRSLKGDELRLLGKGSFGGVIGKTWMGVPVAVKILSISTTSQKQQCLIEASTMCALSHRFICRLEGVVTDIPPSVALALQRAPPDLHRRSHLPAQQQLARDMHRRRSHLPAQQQLGTSLGIIMPQFKQSLGNLMRESDAHVEWWLRAQFGIQIACALSYMHKKGVLHRDLKSDNVMITHDNEIRLVDFGLALITQADGPVNTDLLGTVANSQAAKGSCLWMAPEILAAKEGGRPYSSKSDVFSFAITAFEIACRKFPYTPAFRSQVSPSDLLESLHNTRPGWSNSVPEEWKIVVEECWAYAPADRPDAEDLIQKFTQLSERWIISAPNAGTGAGNAGAGSTDARMYKAGIHFGQPVRHDVQQHGTPVTFQESNNAHSTISHKTSVHVQPVQQSSQNSEVATLALDFDN